jgi:hypothetical protein
MAYTLFDTTSANLVAVLPSEAAALEFVRRSLSAHGPGYVASWVLERDDPPGRPRHIAGGQTLTDRAR